MILKVEKSSYSDKNLILPKTTGNEHSRKQQITAIQGLRGVAILAVLLFHIRDDTFKVGFYGVDIFFVISGYLMCMLMSRKLPLDRSKVSDFYFRRLKRIVPTYLFVIFAVQLSAILIWLYPLDYQSLYDESIKPLFFAANIPDDDDANYFAQSAGGYTYFLHLWSLSCEIQFYLFVPLLIFILGHFSPLKRICLVIFIGCASFWYQVLSTKNTEHMALQSRIWQFMCGFLAHYLNESQLLELHSWFKAPKKQVPKALIYLSKLFTLCITIMLIYLVSVPVAGKPLTRLILLSITTLIIARPDSNLILCNSWLVQLGDISYSVYMVHWPIFEWHKYWDIAGYSYQQKVPYLTGLVLIVVSILLGHLIEKAYNRYNAYIKGWKTLVAVVFTLYLLIFGSMYYLKENSVNEEQLLDDLSPEMKEKSHINQNLIQLWNTRNLPDPLEKSQAMGYNKVFKDLAWGLWTCSDRIHIPTTYNFKSMDITATCHMRGKGTKNILVLGNSHARTMFYGIEYHFHYLYDHLTLLANHQCVLIRLQDKRNYMTKEKFFECQLFLRDVVKMLKQMDHQIDVIIVGHAYLIPIDMPITVKDIQQDAIYREIQQFYTSLAEIAKEVVFVPVGHFETGVHPHLKILQRQILYDGSLDMFRTPIEYNRNLWPHLKERIRHINCSKCILIEWEKLWCSTQSGFCETIDFDRKVSYFSDANHHNAYGALRIGLFIRDLYDKWLEDRSKTEIRRHPLNLNEKPVEKAKRLMNEAAVAIGQSNRALSNFAFNWLEHLRLDKSMEVDEETRKMLMEFNFNEFDLENIKDEEIANNRDGKSPDVDPKQDMVNNLIAQKTHLAIVEQLKDLLNARRQAQSNNLKENLLKNQKIASLLLQVI